MPEPDDLPEPGGDDVDAMMDAMVAPPALDVELVEIAALVYDDKNANVGDVGSHVASLRELGQHRPAVVQRGTNKIIAGNTMTKAAELLGWTHINVLWVDDDDRTAIRRAIIDNEVGRKSKRNDDVLRTLLEEVGDEPLPGLDDRTVAKLMADMEKDKPAEPVYPIAPEMNESYSYVLVVATNDVDRAWLETNFRVRRERSYKSAKVGESRVITVTRLQAEWDDAPPAFMEKGG